MATTTPHGAIDIHHPYVPMQVIDEVRRKCVEVAFKQLDFPRRIHRHHAKIYE